MSVLNSISTSSIDLLTAAIDRLRSLSQIDHQAHWHCHWGDLPLTEALSPEQWQTWTIAPVNARNHVAWNKGAVVWLGQRLTIPTRAGGYSISGLVVRLAVMWWAKQAEIFINGERVQEGDIFDCSTRLLLSSQAQPGAMFEVALRLVAPGHDEGALVHAYTVYEQPQTAACPEPGFVADELAVLQGYLTEFAPDRLLELTTAIASLAWAEVGDRTAFDQSLMAMRQQLAPLGNWVKQRQIKLLGHAHLDLAWLWTVDDTWEAAERTFASVLDLQQAFPELIFCHSTPALYAWIERHRPALFAQMQAAIATGRWEVVAGLWIEPELNLVSGESLVRQVLYGQRYVQEKFWT
ncbi:MAG: alpha-mannosidase, partial [Leptolyngbyaceae cyanobacterium SL_7_1]|nr:alpha-mannosidase [Leptolyngbyaceae cyanobacterium SL_7_1]